MVAEWWVTVDFDSKYKMLLGETMSHGCTYLFVKKFKTRICIIIPTPYNIRLTYVGVEGVPVTYTVLPAD